MGGVEGEESVITAAYVGLLSAEPTCRLRITGSLSKEVPAVSRAGGDTDPAPGAGRLQLDSSLALPLPVSYLGGCWHGGAVRPDPP